MIHGWIDGWPWFFSSLSIPVRLFPWVLSGISKVISAHDSIAINPLSAIAGVYFDVEMVACKGSGTYLGRAHRSYDSASYQYDAAAWLMWGSTSPGGSTPDIGIQKDFKQIILLTSHGSLVSMTLPLPCGMLLNCKAYRIIYILIRQRLERAIGPSGLVVASINSGWIYGSTRNRRQHKYIFDVSQVISDIDNI